MDLNKVMIIGHLTRDPEIRNIPSGETVANFGLATNRVWNDREGQRQQAVEYHNIVAWRKLADICGQYLKKGNRVYIEGRLQTRQWEGQDGIKRYRTEIIARDLIMLTPLSASRTAFPAPSISIPRPSPSLEETSLKEEVPTIEIEPEVKEVPAEGQEKEKKIETSKPSEEEGISIEDIPF